MPVADVLSSTVKGGMSGATMGGPAGAAVGAGLNLATSLFQEIKANKLKNKAESAFPDLVDPNQSAYLAELDQKRKSIETGAAFQSGMDAIDQTTASTQNAITKSTGGDVTSTIQSLLQAARNSGRAKNEVLAQGQNQQFAYNNLYGNLMNQISGRKMQLQMQRSQQNLAEWSKMKQGANQNFQAGAAGGASSLLDGLGGGGQGGAAVDGDATRQTAEMPRSMDINAVLETLPGAMA